MNRQHDSMPSTSAAPIDPDVAAFMDALCGPDAPPPLVTHGACVFLADETAYKIKRPVKLPYLDFSTFEKRRAVCEKEWRLNVVAAPQLYHGVSVIARRPDGVLALDEPGEPVEPLVRMRRFPQSALLDVMAREGRLGLEMMPPLADAVRASHAAAPVRMGGIGAKPLGAVLSGVAEGLAGTDALAAEARPVLDRCADAFAAAAPALHRRAAQGAVRRCHGDLHLGNIVWLDGAPVLFDALEFDDALATTDILYDLAFLLMDLKRHGLDAHANALLNAYFDGAQAETLEGVGVLGALAALRAGVRARVALDAAKPGALDEARAYVRLADVLSAPSPSAVVGIGGLSGSGKSVLARALAPRAPGPCGAFWLRSDVERKALVGVPVTSPAPKDAYARSVGEAVYERLRAKAAWAAAQGGVVIVDAVHAREEERDALEAVAQAQGVPFLGLWLDCGETERARRAEARRGDVSDADGAVARGQSAYDLGEMRWRRLNAEAPFERLFADAEAAIAALG